MQSLISVVFLQTTFYNDINYSIMLSETDELSIRLEMYLIKRHYLMAQRHK